MGLFLDMRAVLFLCDYYIPEDVTYIIYIYMCITKQQCAACQGIMNEMSCYWKKKNKFFNHLVER